MNEWNEKQRRKKQRKHNMNKGEWKKMEHDCVIACWKEEEEN